MLAYFRVTSTFRNDRLLSYSVFIVNDFRESSLDDGESSLWFESFNDYEGVVNTAQRLIILHILSPIKSTNLVYHDPFHFIYGINSPSVKLLSSLLPECLTTLRENKMYALVTRISD